MDGNSLNPAASQAIAKKLREFLLLRPNQVKIRNEVTALVIEWESRDIRKTNLRRILETETIKSLYPGHWPDNVVLAKRLPKTIAQQIFNYPSVAKALVDYPEPNPVGEQDVEVKCPCQNLFRKKFRTVDNHVYTGDPSLIRCGKLRKLFGYGANFRTKVRRPDVVATIESALREFASKQSQFVEGLEIEDFGEWEREVMRLVRQTVPRDRFSEHGIPFCAESRNYLRFLHLHLVITPTDKASRNASFICRNLYNKMLVKEFTDSRAYVAVQASAKEIIQRHMEFLRPLPLDLFGSERLGYLYFIPKLHKPEPAQRYIAGMASCTTTPLSRMLTKVLTLILQTIRTKDDATIIETGVRRFFVVNGYDEVARFLGGYKRTRGIEPHLYTGDFSEMYTNIPHEDLRDQIHWSCSVAWEYESSEGKETRIRVKRSRNNTFEAEWRTARMFAPDSDESWHLTLDDVIRLVRFLVDNTFVCNGGRVRRQTVGLPMGTNCAPPLANLYLFAYEARFIDRLCNTGQIAIARSFHTTFRLIDDVLSLDNKCVEDYVIVDAPEDLDGRTVGGIYPEALKLNSTSVSSKKVHFLGMTIKYIKGNLVTDVFDKRRNFPYYVIRYPHMDSVIPSNIPYGVFTGLLYTRYRICNFVKQFITSSTEAANILIRQGCVKLRLKRLFRAFLTKQSPLRWKLSIPAVCRQFESGLGS
jgi:hypothetical protein